MPEPVDPPSISRSGRARPAALSEVEVLIAAIGDDAPVIPAYAHPGDAGADLLSTEDVVLGPGERATVATGVAIALPAGFAAFVVPRSGLAARHGITVVNSPGTIDAGYRGEISVTLLNTDARVPYPVAVGDRIAQLIVMPVVRARFIPVGSLPGSHRGTDGFGSTGDRPTTPDQLRRQPTPNQEDPRD